MNGITILGGGPSWTYCQDGKTSELWGCLTNLADKGLGDKPYTKLFAFDGTEIVVNGVKQQNHVLLAALEANKSRNIPIMGNQPYATEPFPLIEVVKRFKSSYFMNTLSYVLAYALYLGFDKIFLHGIDGGPQWDYQFGKPYITFWTGVACGMGVEVIMGRDSLKWAYQAGLDTFPKAMMVYENVTENR